MIFHDWTRTGIIPSPDAWYQYQPGGSADYVIYDSSGNERNLFGTIGDAPTLVEDVVSGHPAWLFDGTVDPLSWTGPVTFKHVFVLASNGDSSFADYQGLVTGETLGDILVGGIGTTKFFDLGIGNIYSKEGIEYEEDDQQAPMGGFQLLEVKNYDGITLDGIQIGRQRNIAGRNWQGYFAEMIAFERVLSRDEIRQVRLYFNLKFGEWQRGLPFYFPSGDIVPTDLDPSRFYDQPPDYDKFTDSWEYEDGGKDFNEVASDAPRHWEYAYPAVPKAQLPIFDEFWNQARLINPFLFKDPENYVWDNVRIEEYNRNHPAHMRWRHDVAFRLVGYNSTGVLEPESDDSPILFDMAIALTDGGTELTDGA